MCASAFVVAGLSAQNGRAVPTEPVEAILDAFHTHRVVALGEGIGHGDERAYAFRVALLRDRRFIETVNDLVVESGSARYQDVIDRFVQGGDVSDESLRHVWQDATLPTVLVDDSIYQDFFRAVRAVNLTVRPERRLRVLLGDPPIEWEHVTTRTDYTRWLEQRDSFPADLIRREVLAKGRRALVIYGQIHFQRLNVMSNYDMSSPLAQTIVSLLERDAPRSVFVIWPTADLEKIQPSVASWPVPSVAKIKETVLGSKDFSAYTPANGIRIAVGGRGMVPVPREQWKSLRADAQIDAVMYEGPWSSIRFAKPAASLCVDPEHLQVRLRRIALAGLPASESERMKNACAK
jgi:hypothetical protein